ncbi:MAG: MOSC domain-containing protein [Candidatus Latescibacteria bacterium]|nr:MOSC domain-containing protein [Candidatus Latescibacterota bacterium]
MTTNTAEAKHLTADELNAGLDHIRQTPAEQGTLELITRRPAIGERDLLEEAQLDTDEGLVGDNWKTRGADQSPPRQPNPLAQLTLMNARSADLIAVTKERWPLAGDQLYVDFDLSVENLPPGSRVQIGTAVVEITPEPHPGCKKFVERFGMDAMLFVNGDVGKALRLRGVNTRIVEAGTIRQDDAIKKL